MKLKLLIAIVLLINPAYSQEKQEGGIIYLKEVIVEQSKKYNKKVSIKTKGKKNSTFSVQASSTFVSKIEDLPKGKISSVKFYFNNRKNTDFYRNNFRLKIFKVNSDNKPGSEILEKDIRFSVNADHKGEIELDLSELDLLNLNEIFLGLELLNQNNELGFSLDCVTVKKPTTYYKLENKDNQWFQIPNIKIRSELVILQ